MCDLLHPACRPGSAVLTTRSASRARHAPSSPLAGTVRLVSAAQLLARVLETFVYDGPCPCFSALGRDPGESLFVGRAPASRWGTIKLVHSAGRTIRHSHPPLRDPDSSTLPPVPFRSWPSSWGEAAAPDFDLPFPDDRWYGVASRTVS